MPSDDEFDASDDECIPFTQPDPLIFDDGFEKYLSLFESEGAKKIAKLRWQVTK